MDIKRYVGKIVTVRHEDRRGVSDRTLRMKTVGSFSQLLLNAVLPTATLAIRYAPFEGPCRKRLMTIFSIHVSQVCARQLLT